jgi:hypothetical protein
MEKIELIKKITELHPACGVEDKVSWYVGGMRDTGDWYIDKLQSKSTKWLKWFYKENTKPFEPDPIDNSEVMNFNVDGHNFWMTKDSYNFMIEKYKEIEKNTVRKLFR